MKKVIVWVSGFLSSNGEASSKRLVGVVCAGFLCGAMLKEYNPSDSIVYAVSALAFGCLGLTSAEKIFQKKNANEENKS